MNHKIWRNLFVIFSITIISLLLNPLKIHANSKTIQVDKMKLEFQDKETVVLIEVLKKEVETLRSVTYPSIKKVVVAEGIKALPDGMFERFPNVEVITLPTTLTDFESGASFIGAYKWYYYSHNFRMSLEKLKSITVASKNKTYKSIDGVLFSKDGKSIIHYPKEKKTTRFIVPDTVEYVHVSSNFIKEMTLGANVKEFSYSSLPAVTSMYVSANNKKFTGVNGVVFSKDKSVLLWYPSAKGEKYAVPKGTKKITRNAFDSSNVKYVTLPEGLLSISYHAFANTKIRTITLPKSLSILHEDAFDNSSISYVYVHKQNGVLTSVDGIVYNKDKSLLLYWPEARVEENLKFADTLTVLDLTKIKNLEQSKSITIPKSLNSILNTQENQFSKVILEKGNTSFVLNQGILYSSNLTMIKLYPNQNPITELVLPENVVYLDYNMFTKENTTTSITLSKNLRYIESVKYIRNLTNKYSGFYHLTEVLIPEENPYFTSIDGVLYSKDMKTLQWYPQNSPITTYTIPGTVTTIEQMQLINAANLVELNIPASLQLGQLKEAIFNSYSYMEELFGASSLELEKINVDSENADLKSVDGVLYTKRGDFLLLYPSGKKDKKFVVPQGVRVMNSKTFNPYLEELVFSEAVSSIYETDPNVYDAVTDYNPFIHFTALKRFDVVNDKTSYHVVDGVLYSKDGSILVSYPIAKEEKKLQLSSTIKYIQCEGNLAFANSLKEISISNHKYFVTNEGSLYYYDGDLFIKPGSNINELKVYIEKLLLMNDTKILGENNQNNESSTTNLKSIELVDFTLEDTYYVSKENEKAYAGEKTVYIIDDVNPLSNYFKKNAVGVENVIIAEGVMKIPELVFSLFPNAKEINISSTCNGLDGKISDNYTYLGGIVQVIKRAFPKLSAVNVAPENDWMTSIDGVLYDRMFTELLLYPANKTNQSLNVPDSVRSIFFTIATNSDGSEYTNNYLKEITLGAYAMHPPLYFIKRSAPNLETVHLSPYNLYYSISKGKLVTMQAYRN